MATRRQIAAARRNIRRAQAANRGRSRRGGGRRRRGNPRNRAPGSRNVSTPRYGGRRRATTASARRATYVYPRGSSRTRGRTAAYPIYDLAHARNALARAAQPQTAGSVAQVKRALRAKGGEFARLANRSTAGQGRRRGGRRGGRRR